MLNIPPELLTRYVAFIDNRAVPTSQYNENGFPEEGSKSLSQFLGKLKEKNQTEVQIRQAEHAVTLYSDLKCLFSFSQIS